MLAGFIAIVGRPNVGKSTLLNQILGKKLSITSRKPQTTRHRILGIKTDDETQMIFFDTPGIHLGQKKAINRYMNKAAITTLSETDVILFVVEALAWQEEDAYVLSQIKRLQTPVILVINKIDKVPTRDALLPFIEGCQSQHDFRAIIPISAKKAEQIPALLLQIRPFLQESDYLYDPSQLTDKTDRFIASEMVREKLMRHLGQELPYTLTVWVEALEHDEDIVRISAVIFVTTPGQKKIVIGKQGELLKEIGIQARGSMESFFEKKVFLKLWVKVKAGWFDNKKILNQLGYD